MDVQTTRLESDEEVRQALAKYRSGGRETPAGATAGDDQPALFRPTQRPATPVLIALDDGADDGETVRIRKERFVIGRNDGDLTIANDGQMSGRHAELRRSIHKGRHRWTLVDLGSTNGTFVRIRHAMLESGQEFIVGRTRFRFELPKARIDANPAEQPTRSWLDGEVTATLPALVRVTVDGSGERVQIDGTDLWIGKNPDFCHAVLADDPFANARHARVQRDAEGRWTVENNKAPNGVWLRIERLRLSGTCRFLLGEQQFLLRIPS